MSRQSLDVTENNFNNLDVCFYACSKRAGMTAIGRKAAAF